MASSSCSYAASAMAKSLFVKGADFVAASVFMVASTNLVIELGIVLIVLMGWQFAASEFVGGVIMVVLLAATGGFWLRGRLVVEARQRLTEEAGHGHGQPPAEGTSPQHEPWATKLRSKAGWADAASYTMADLKMLRRELAIGFTVAGFLAVVVPTQVWNAVFIHGHGGWTTLENVAVGPLIALVSFVCSIGNVPLAAALWKGGISFGGVVSFIFADLISLPLLLIYRRYYGTRLMARMLVILWGVMSIAGLITEVIFQAAGLVPAVRPSHLAPAHFSWGYTTYLNIAFLLLFAVLYWAYRNRARLAGDERYALDLVCGMQAEVANAPAWAVQAANGSTFAQIAVGCASRRVRNDSRPRKTGPGKASSPCRSPCLPAARARKERETGTNDDHSARSRDLGQSQAELRPRGSVLPDSDVVDPHRGRSRARRRAAKRQVDDHVHRRGGDSCGGLPDFGSVVVVRARSGLPVGGEGVPATGEGSACASPGSAA